MKMVQMIKVLTIGVFMVTSMMMVDLANAQTQPSTDTTASVVSSSSKQAFDSVSPPARDVLIRGGYNVGRGTASQVPGCTGPVSFCNMYSGS